MNLQESKSYDVISFNRFGYRVPIVERVSSNEADRILKNMKDFYSHMEVVESLEI